jgi:hypothetical protein
MDDGQRKKTLRGQPVVQIQTIRSAYRNQEMEILAAPTRLHPRANSVFADMERDVGERSAYVRVVEPATTCSLAARGAHRGLAAARLVGHRRVAETRSLR